jgi:FAD/FMN-containing dehydrogenase
VLCFDIITGTGELLRTGTAGHAQSNPFFRFFGPDLAGLFTGDCGALGVKARITLPLKRRNEAFAAASFDFSSFEALHGAFHALALEGLDEENFGLDQALQQGQIGRNDSVAAKAQMAGAVLKTSSSLASGVKQLAKMAIAGDKALKAASYAAHFIIEGVDGADAQAKQKVIQRIASQFGTEIPNSVPTVVRGMPFAPFTNVLGPKGERWLPMHALLAHSAVLGFHAAITDYWASQAEVMAKHGIFTGGMFMNVGSSAFVYEPTFYWPGAQHIYHQRTVPADHLAGLPTYPAAPDADQEVYRMKKDVVDLMHAHGAAHLQVGRSYPLMKGRNGPAADLLRAIKAALDPKGILNPGALGV